VLNEVLVNCRRKAEMSRDEAGDFLDGIRDICEVVGVTADIHDIGRALGVRYRLQVHDAMIAAAALASGCRELLTEDMQDGLVLEGDLTIRNPFSEV
jgi:predicted nucleic acid-binding protein